MSATASWTAKAPKKGAEREQLIGYCGDKCFLMPKERKFPICPRCQGDRCTCGGDCSGLRAARIRAAQWGYTKVKAQAERMMAERGCPGLSAETRAKYVPKRSLGNGSKKEVDKKKKNKPMPLKKKKDRRTQKKSMK